MIMNDFEKVEVNERHTVERHRCRTNNAISAQTWWSESTIVPGMFVSLARVNICRAVGAVLSEFPSVTRKISYLVPSTLVTERVVNRYINKGTKTARQKTEQETE